MFAGYSYLRSKIMSDKYDKMQDLFPDDQDNDIDEMDDTPEKPVWIEYRSDSAPFIKNEDADKKDALSDQAEEGQDAAGEENSSEMLVSNKNIHPLQVFQSFGKTDKPVPAQTEEDGIEERDYMPIRFRRDRRTGCLGGLMYAVFVISVSVIIACVLWMAASDVLALNKEEVTATITIPKNFDMNDVATTLRDSGIIEYKSLFILYSKISDAESKIAPGTYELSSEFDYRAIVKKMYVGSDSMVVTRLTFPEGYTMAQIFEILAENDICSEDDLYDAAADYNFNYSYLGDIQDRRCKASGRLFVPRHL